MTTGAEEQGQPIGGISHRAAAWLAWSLCALTWALTALSLLLLTLNLSYPGIHVFDWWLGNALVVVDAVVGAVVASRRPENAVGWLLCLSGVAIGTSSFASQYAIYALLARPGSLPAGEAVAWIAAWVLPIIIGLQAPETPHPIVHRPPLLPRKIRRAKDPRSLLREAARRDRSRGLEPGSRGGGGGDRATCPRLAVAAGRRARAGRPAVAPSPEVSGVAALRSGCAV